MRMLFVDFFHIPLKEQQHHGILVCLQTLSQIGTPLKEFLEVSTQPKKNHAALMKGLCALKKERKEKVHSFTQIFAAYLKNFSEADKPSDKVLIEYYTSTLGLELAMFSKMKGKPMLAETYE